MPGAGETLAYRPKPQDFRDRYVEMGLSDELREYYGTNYRVLRRWVDEEGYEDLYEARREYQRQSRWPNGAPGSRKRRYALGQTLTTRGLVT
jgi:hypothetical protein